MMASNDDEQQTAQRTDLDLDYFRRRLAEEKALAEQTISGTRGSETDGTGEMGMDRNELGTQSDNHPADAATEVFMRDQDQVLIQNAKDILNQIKRAEEKFADGTYGICDQTHQPIPVERLEALPYATLTVEAESLLEQA